MPTLFRSDGWVKSATGPAVPGAQIYVCTQPANTVPPEVVRNGPVQAFAPTPLADLFSDPNGLVPITQPIITDGFGHYDFYAAADLYTLVVMNAGAVQQVYPDQSVGGLGTGTNSTNLIAGTNIQIIGNVISATGSSGPTLAIKINGSPVTSQTVLNFTDTADIEWTSNGVGGVMANLVVTPGVAFRKQVTVLTPVQLAALTTTFLPVTETPAAGFRIVPLLMSLQYVFNTTDYGATGTFTFFWGNTPGANFAYRVLNATNFINNALADRFAVCTAVSTQDSSVPQTPTIVDGQPIFVGNAAAPFSTGDGNVIVTAYYSIEADV